MKRLFTLLILAVAFTACEDDENLATTSTSNTPNIIGNYELTSLVADAAVDFNGDGTSSTQLFNESFCFDNRMISFDAAGNFTVDVPDLDLDNNNVLTCVDNSYAGTYTIDMNSLLTITYPINGGSVSEDKTVTVTNTTFSFTLNRAEVMQYINPTTGTPADAINTIQVTYTRI